MIAQRAVAAPDVGGHAVQLTLFHQLHGTAKQRWVLQLHVSVNEQDVRRPGHARSGVSANRRQAAGYYLNVETISIGEGKVRRAVSGSGVGDKNFSRRQE